MTAFNSSIPTDLNGDGSASTNQMNETNCFNGSFITLNSNNTFVADSKGIDINTKSNKILIFENKPIKNHNQYVFNESSLIHEIE